MISVSEALDALFALLPAHRIETVPLLEAHGRVLAGPVAATRDQPPFAASAMDGYAVVDAKPGVPLTVIGESAAGRGFADHVGEGQAVRIFTGAPIPTGATRVILQEDVTRQGDRITPGDRMDPGDNIRAAGNDFRAGSGMPFPRVLSSSDIAQLAAMNVARVPVSRRPRVALVATGDELVMPGETPGPDQIVASNTFGLHALLRDLGAEPRMLPIARDTVVSLKTVLGMIDDADLVITVGGASKGDHDLVAPVAAELGMERAFHMVAMRPGKPLMSGRLGSAVMIGLPGNPVSAMVCGHVFVGPVVRAMQGLPAQAVPRLSGELAHDLAANGPREHYMRARHAPDGLHVFERQDSSLLHVLGAADALVVRPVLDPVRKAGDLVDYIPL
ncbi:molybdopterin molybdotransferase MoeA [Citreimonas salinaria]|uniref:Molybdopterin molybdenumtransferase n=1 Tax=Citreimonas salinaria TaxID=321339 RepID=A0A1H3G8U5_9RHOB|nr:molybdopterin molybdotransferase MoeA [Citreimonas salinaria]SDX98779.1 molybdopterin molybdotransferase [Citreimonas salinaria]